MATRIQPDDDPDAGRNAAITAYCRSRGYPEPDFEFGFCPGRKFAFDVAFVGERVAVEVEGGVYGRGKPCPVCKRKPPAGHGSIDRTKRDHEKYNLAAVLGWRLVRVRPEQVESGELWAWLDAVFGPAAGPGGGRG